MSNKLIIRIITKINYLILSIIFCGFSSIPFAQKLSFQSNGSLVQISYDSVLIYNLGSKENPLAFIEEFIDNENHIIQENIISAATLSHKETKQLDQRMFSKNSYGVGSSACFEPHFGIAYFKNGLIVFYNTICLDCSRAYPNYQIDVQLQCPDVGEETTYYLCSGMSDSFEKFLSKLGRKYNFTHCQKK